MYNKLQNTEDSTLIEPQSSGLEGHLSVEEKQQCHIYVKSRNRESRQEHLGNGGNGGDGEAKGSARRLAERHASNSGGRGH